MPDDLSVCPACGARLPADALACDLCGHDLALPTDDDLLDADDGEGLGHAPAAPVPARAAGASGTYCNACGTPNPAGARFCSECGAALNPAVASAAARPPAVLRAPVVPGTPVSAPAGLDAPTGQRLWAMVGGAVLLVAGLFAIATLRQPAPPAPAEAQEGARGQVTPPGGTDPAAAAPSDGMAPTGVLATLTPAQTATLDSLGRVADALTGTAKQDKQRELARMQYAFGRPDEAGTTMEAVAAASNAVADHRKAGDFLYQWMETLDEEQRGPVAARVIAAYDAVLAKEEGDLDSRTRLGWAAQYAGDNPMRAVMETQAVLQRDSNHVGANYNRAFMLLKIGRTDQALEQLRKVERLAGPTSALGRQAAQLTTAIREQQAGGASAPAPGTP